MFATLQVYLYIYIVQKQKNLLTLKETVMSNLNLWNKVEKTNPKYTKNIKFGGRSFTTIDAQYQIKNATEQFGSYGKGFGLSEVNYDIIPTNGGDILAAYKATFFYVEDGKRYEFPISTGIFIEKKGRVDEDFSKKAETDMLTKALSKLGFNADIFMGRFDDKKYVDAINEQFEQEAKDKLKASRQEVVRAINFSKSKEELASVYNKYPSFKVSLKELYAKKGKELAEQASKKVFTDLKETITPDSEGGKKYKASASLEEVETMIAEATDVKDLALIHTAYPQYKDDILVMLTAKKNALNA